MGIYDKDAFTLNTSGGYDANGNKQASTPSSKTGLIERKRHLMITDKGEQITSEANIFLDYDSSITLEDTVTFDSREWIIKKIYHPQDFCTKKTQIFLV